MSIKLPNKTKFKKNYRNDINFLLGAFSKKFRTHQYYKLKIYWYSTILYIITRDVKIT